MQTARLIAIPYGLVRAPLAILDSGLVRRLPDDSRPRLLLDRGIGTFDQIAGRLLHDADVTRAGTERIQRGDRLTRAADLEAEAATRRRAAADKAQAASRRASEKRAQAEQVEAEGHKQAETTAREGKQAASAKARTRATKAKQQVDTRANKSLASIRQGLKQTEAVAEAREHQAEDKAKGELDDAAETRASATAERTDAGQLGDLAKAKRAQRKA